MRPTWSVLSGSSTSAQDATNFIEVSFLLSALVCLSFPTSADFERNYTVSVYQMQVTPFLSSKMTRKQALTAMNARVAEFETQAEEAARRKSQILVFPEYGLYADFTDFSRATMAVFLETIPNPQERFPWNPCDLEINEDIAILRKLSCMAKKNKLYIVANIGEREICSHTIDRHCPFDGQYQFNTNVAFDSDGVLISRYRKLYLFHEFYFDSARKIEHWIIDAPFGRFVNIIGFDLMFANTLNNVVDKYGVRNILYSNMWPNMLPLYMSASFHASVAWATNVNLISANMKIQLNDKMSGGSGFYKGDSGLEYSFRAPYLMTTNVTNIKPDAHSNFAKPPRREIPDSEQYLSVTYNLDDTGIRSVKLAYPDGIINVCYKKFCCVADYKFSSKPVGIAGYFLAVNSYKDTSGLIDMKFCALTTMTLDKSSCPALPVGADVRFARFKRLNMFANSFRTKYIYPQVILLKNNSYDVLNPSSYYNKGKIKLRNTFPLHSASLMGRIY